MILGDLLAFVRHAKAYFRDARDAEPGHTQAIRARHARHLLEELHVECDGPTREDIERNGPCIYVSNHTSNLDALLICSCFEGDLRILAKSSLFRIPWLGRILRMEKHICVYRGKNASARNAAIRENIREAIAEGGSVLFFPEGTRTADGTLGKFKLGAFYNAIQTGVPVVPMVIRGAFECMPKQTLHIRPGRCSITLLDPIPLPDPSSGEESERAQALCDQAFAAIQSHLLRGSAPDPA